jgi:hypothetical protein
LTETKQFHSPANIRDSENVNITQTSSYTTNSKESDEEDIIHCLMTFIKKIKHLNSALSNFKNLLNDHIARLEKNEGVDK